VIKRSLLFIAYWIASVAALLVIAFPETYRVGGYIAFVALFLFHLSRGRDYYGNPTLLGIRGDSSFFGKQRSAEKCEER